MRVDAAVKSRVVAAAGRRHGAGERCDLADLRDESVDEGRARRVGGGYEGELAGVLLDDCQQLLQALRQGGGGDAGGQESVAEPVDEVVNFSGRGRAAEEGPQARGLRRVIERVR